jgi:hypothetical protein
MKRTLLACLPVAVCVLFAPSVSVRANLVITEIMYNPAGDEPETEWVELYNVGPASVDIGGYYLDDEDPAAWSAIPGGTTLNAAQFAVLFNGGATSESVFRSEWQVPTDAIVVGVGWRNLANNPAGSGDEVLGLKDGGGNQVDVVDYDDSGDWPSDSPQGASIHLTDFTLDNNVGTHWARSEVNAANGTVNPTAGGFFNVGDVGSPGSAGAASTGGPTAVPEPSALLFVGSLSGLALTVRLLRRGRAR